MIIDSHCHLDMLEDLDEVLKKAQEKGMVKIISPSASYQSCLKNLEIAKKYENVFVALGIHPDEVGKINDLDSEIEKLDDLINQNKEQIVGIGECGLDFKFDKNIKQNEINGLKKGQIRLFKAHIKLAKKYDLPLIIHNRKANDEIFEILKQVQDDNVNLRGVFHCFLGGKKTLKKYLELDNFYFGLGGIVTFDEGHANVAKDIPLERIVLETDSPYLTPNPVKQEKSWPNEPANTHYVAEKISEVKEMSLEEIGEITSDNCSKLFRLN